MTLKEKAVSATFWSGAEALLRQTIQFVIAIVLARLLTPEEFGTIALLALFIGIAAVFVDSGFTMALIQQQDVTHTDETTVFWFNLGMGIFMTIGLWAIAPWIASFFGQPILVPLTRLLALNLLISALGAIQNTLLAKRLDFKTQMKIGTAALLISGTLAICLAWRGFGVWALALQTLTATSIKTALLWYFNPWRPSRMFSFSSAHRFFNFGSYILFTSLIDIAYNRIYTLLIGKYFSIRELGLYNRADSTKQLPVSLLTGIVSGVAFPIFSAASAASNDKKQLRKGFRQAIRGIMLINTPIMLGLIAASEQVIFTVFGEQWIAAVPIMQVLCLGGILGPLHVLNLNVLLAQGYSNLLFRLEIIKKFIGIILIALGAFYGVIGIAWSQVLFSMIAFLINAHYSRIFLDYGVTNQTMDFLPSLIISVVAAGIICLLGSKLTWPIPLVLLVQIACGVGIYSAISWCFRIQALKDIFDIIKKNIDKKKYR